MDTGKPQNSAKEPIMAKEKTVPVTSIKSMSGAIPEFPMPVKIKRLDGTETAITFTAKALRKKEWAGLRDDHLNLAKAAGETGDEPAKFSFAAAVGESMRKVAELVTNCATGWDLSDEFNAANLEELEDNFGGTLDSFLSAYDAAIFHGRLGNS